MKIKPRTWDFTGDFCCWEFQRHTEGNEYIAYPSIFTDGEKVFFGTLTITNCPFCGTKIVLEREQES